MTICEAYNKRFNALLTHAVIASGMEPPFSKENIHKSIVLVKNIIDTYNETENIIPANEHSKELINHYTESLRLLEEKFNSM